MHGRGNQRRRGNASRARSAIPRQNHGRLRILACAWMTAFAFGKVCDAQNPFLPGSFAHFGALGRARQTARHPALRLPRLPLQETSLLSASNIPYGTRIRKTDATVSRAAICKERPALLRWARAASISSDDRMGLCARGGEVVGFCA